MRNAFVRCSVVLLYCSVAACNGQSPASPTQQPQPPGATPTTRAYTVPDPPPGCAPWPPQLAEMLTRLSVPANTCLVREGGAGPSEYRPVGARVIYRNPSPVGGEIGAIGHEICHAHQHRMILDSGVPNITGGDEGAWLMSNWMATDEGSSYLQVGNYTFLGIGGSCARSPQTECWSQNGGGCEMGFCLGQYRNPMEDNAEFCQMWYNPANVGDWAKPNLMNQASRRSSWAMRWLP